jgi:BirA family biotin operon repressor/biotin-[acetyl-CoA-carboxylase] ligase
MGVSKFSLIRILADGRFHSARKLGSMLDVSRAGTLILLQQVEALGLQVEKVRGRGYRLSRRLDLLDAGATAARLASTAPELRLEILDECTSTNSLLAARAVQGAALGLALACEHQSLGRGRRGNQWVSSPGGGLTFSLLWRFSAGAGGLAGLSLAVAAIAAQALERLGVESVQVKWPNDLYCGGRKLGGILVEVCGDMRGPSAVVIGIGINVRLDQTLRDRISQPATDLASCASMLPSRAGILATLLEDLAVALARFSREGFASFREEWLRRHAWQGQQVALSVAQQQVAEGRIVGVAEDGALMLASSRGIQRFHSGELSLRSR